MNRIIILKDEANFDIIEAGYDIGENSLSTSKRFSTAVYAAIDDLAVMPGMGVRRDYNNPVYANMRMWPVPKFSKYLIFYRTAGEFLEVLRVLHGSQDIEAIFAPDVTETQDETQE